MSDTEVKRVRALLGTFVEISAKGENALQSIEAAFEEIATIHRLMSFHEEASDVSRINRAPLSEAVPVDPRTCEVLRFAEEMSEISGGAFDITVAGSLVEAGFLPRPDTASIPLHTSFRDIILGKNNSLIRKNPVWIDLGGIAKGYAVDQAVNILEAAGIERGVVNAGGDMKIFGEPQPVHLRHPFDLEKLYSIGPIRNSAVASSGSYYSQKQGTDPLVDAHKRACVSWEHGITVIAPECMAADALTKVVRLTDSKDLPKILAAYDAQAMLVDRNGVYLLAEKPQRKKK